jgi:hypothetical protein
MTKIETSKQLATQKNKEQHDLQIEELRETRRFAALEISALTETMASLAQTMGHMTREVRSHLFDQQRELKDARQSANLNLELAARTAREVAQATHRSTWKARIGMVLAPMLGAPGAVSAYSLWLHPSVEAREHAQAWQGFEAKLKSLAPAEQAKIFKILRLDQAR